MEIFRRDFSRATLFTMKGQIDSTEIRYLHAKIDDLRRDGIFRVVFDMTNVSFIDSASLGAILSIQRTMKEKNGWLRISALRKEIKEMFRLIRAEKYLDIYEDTETALKGFE